MTTSKMQDTVGHQRLDDYKEKKRAVNFKLSEAEEEELPLSLFSCRVETNEK